MCSSMKLSFFWISQKFNYENVNFGVNHLPPLWKKFTFWMLVLLEAFPIVVDCKNSQDVPQHFAKMVWPNTAVLKWDQAEDTSWHVVAYRVNWVNTGYYKMTFTQMTIASSFSASHTGVKNTVSYSRQVVWLCLLILIGFRSFSLFFYFV